MRPTSLVLIDWRVRLTSASANDVHVQMSRNGAGDFTPSGLAHASCTS
jgi:hypothetical protein